MLPEALLIHSVRDGMAVPHYLGPADHPWLRRLIDELDRLDGRTRRELEASLAAELPTGTPPGRRRLAAHVLARLYARRAHFDVDPRRVRAVLFAAAARSGDRPSALAEAARTLGTPPALVEELLFADLPGERRIATPTRRPGPAEIASDANRLLAQGFLLRARSARVEVRGQTRAVVRQAHLRGLICTVHPQSDARLALEISGPLSLFRNTLRYGRDLASLLPVLPWCDRFRLTARCRIRGEDRLFVVETGDPVPPGPEPRRFDSQVEERFARDFRALAPNWDLVREPEPLPAGDTLIFPDFELVPRDGGGRRWLLEIIGFWTPGYVERKLERLRASGRRDLILCIDEERVCAPGDLPDAALVVRYRRRIDARRVLDLVSEPLRNDT